MQKNIALFVLDQLTWRALPAYGNPFAHTPNIDRIARGSLMIDGCYTPCPLCQPARASFWSGRYPHETGVLSNGKLWPETGIREDLPTLGDLFSDAGWQTRQVLERRMIRERSEALNVNRKKNVCFP